jgi:hypothetical protein
MLDVNDARLERGPDFSLSPLATLARGAAPARRARCAHCRTDGALATDRARDPPRRLHPALLQRPTSSQGLVRVGGGRARSHAAVHGRLDLREAAVAASGLDPGPTPLGRQVDPSLHRPGRLPLHLQAWLSDHRHPRPRALASSGARSTGRSPPRSRSCGCTASQGGYCRVPEVSSSPCSSVSGTRARSGSSGQSGSKSRAGAVAHLASSAPGVKVDTARGRSLVPGERMAFSLSARPRADS